MRSPIRRRAGGRAKVADRRLPGHLRPPFGVSLSPSSWKASDLAAASASTVDDSRSSSIGCLFAAVGIAGCRTSSAVGRPNELLRISLAATALPECCRDLSGRLTAQICVLIRRRPGAFRQRRDLRVDAGAQQYPGVVDVSYPLWLVLIQDSLGGQLRRSRRKHRWGGEQAHGHPNCDHKQLGPLWSGEPTSKVTTSDHANGREKPGTYLASSLTTLVARCCGSSVTKHARGARA